VGLVRRMRVLAAWQLYRAAVGEREGNRSTYSYVLLKGL
jgi:hypothetical protein